MPVSNGDNDKGELFIGESERTSAVQTREKELFNKLSDEYCKPSFTPIFNQNNGCFNLIMLLCICDLKSCTKLVIAIQME
jgi:hypothetical protein